MLQPLPGIGLLQQFAGIDDEITAICFVQQTWFDEGEVGEQCAHLLHMLDTADQIRIAGLFRHDDRGAVSAAMVYDDVDLVARWPLLLAAIGTAFAHDFGQAGLIAIFGKLVQPFGHILLYGLEIGKHSRLSLITRL